MNLGKSFATAPKELKFNNKVFTHPKEILEILESEKFYWLIDSTISDAIIEIKNKDKEKERLKKYEKAKKEAIANLTKTERKALGL